MIGAFNDCQEQSEVTKEVSYLEMVDLTAEDSIEVFCDKHRGTRIEAPGYLIEGGKRIDQHGSDSFEVQAVLLDLAHKKSGQPIDDEDLEGAEERAGLAVREGEAVILHTGCDDEAQYPYLSQNGAEFLEFKRPFIVGTDTANLDQGDSEGLPAHAILLRAGILVLEGLCNLEKIQQARFRLSVVPVTARAAVSTVRVAAVLDD